MTVKEIIEKLNKGEVSSVELTDYYLSRIDEMDTELHSFLYVNKEGARALAKILHEQKTSISDSKLFGVPYATKDNIAVEGMQCTAGSRILENYIAPYDATITARLKQSGCVLLGKTNLDEFAMGSSTENSGYGATKNPHDHARVPGGSSGGSAAAVAAGLAPFALGSDTGGSIRQPAAFCGVVGFKPTYGAVSRYGLIALASSLDQIGTFTQTVQDAQLIFPFLIGKDHMDATSLTLEEPFKYKTPSEFTIGVVKEFFDGEGLDAEVREAVLNAVEVYKKMGAQIREISLPHAPSSLAVYYILMPSEASSNLARYDGIRYGKHLSEEKPDDLLERYKQVRAEGFGKEVLRRIMLGTYTLSAGYYDAYYLKAQKVRTLIAQDFDTAFKDVDVILAPTTPTVPFRFGEKTSDLLKMYLSDVYTVSANLAGLPAVSVPVGMAKKDGKDLPIGMQIIGARKHDFTTLNVARMYENATQ